MTRSQEGAELREPQGRGSGDRQASAKCLLCSGDWTDLSPGCTSSSQATHGSGGPGSGLRGLWKPLGAARWRMELTLALSAASSALFVPGRKQRRFQVAGGLGQRGRRAGQGCGCKAKGDPRVELHVPLMLGPAGLTGTGIRVPPALVSTACAGEGRAGNSLLTAVHVPAATLQSHEGRASVPQKHTRAASLRTLRSQL